MSDRQRLFAIAWTSALLAACGGGSGSTGLRTPGQGHVTVTVTDGTDAVGTGANASSASTSTRSLRVDAGVTGFAHALEVFEGASYTAELQECDGETDTHCLLHAETAGTPFGAPSPVSAGGVPVCLQIDYDSDLSGMLDLETGDLSYEARLSVRIHLGNDIAQPCPACVPPVGEPRLGEAGICVGGADEGQPCTVGGLADASFLELRGTSLACRPEQQPVGAFTTIMSATTGEFVLAVSPSSPTCRSFTWRDDKCLCDVCDDPAATPCRADADCPAVDGIPGVCGVANVGAPTQQNHCLDEVCTSTGATTGVCADGPFDLHCALQTFRSCITDADCPALGDTCTVSPRSCFLDSIELTGEPDRLENGMAHPTLVGGFCAGSLGTPAADTAAGFPGPVSYVWPVSLIVDQ